MSKSERIHHLTKDEVGNELLFEAPIATELTDKEHVISGDRTRQAAFDDLAGVPVGGDLVGEQGDSPAQLCLKRTGCKVRAVIQLTGSTANPFGCGFGEPHFLPTVQHE